MVSVIFALILPALVFSEERCLDATAASGAGLLQSTGPKSKASPTEIKEEQNTDTDTGDLATKVKELMEEIDAASTNEKNATSADVSATVNDMMAKFQAMYVAKFTASFKKTQALIKLKVQELKASTDDSLKQHAATDAANVALSACRKDEQSKLKTYENCRAEGEWLNSTWAEACKAMEDAQYHEWEVAEDLAQVHHCDLVNTNCSNLDALKKHVDDHRALSNQMRKEYRAKVKACNSAQDTAIQNEADCHSKLVAFETQKAKCDHSNFQKQVRMCNFGTSIQDKCEKYASLNKLVNETKNGKGTVNSDTDRAEQWKKAETLRCMLKSYTGHGSTSPKVKSTCESKINYKRDIGGMDYMTSAILKNMQPSPPNFRCSENTVPIAGENWTTGNTSDKYKAEEKYVLDVKFTPVGSAPFNFCLPKSTEAHCRGFLCPAQFKPKPDPLTVKCSLIRCTVYECCDGATPAGAAAEPAAAAAEPAAAEPAAEAAAAAAPAAAEAAAAPAAVVAESPVAAPAPAAGAEAAAPAAM